MLDNLLWTPSSVKELICLDSDEFEDYEIDDAEIEAFVNRALVDWLNGKLDTGTLTDILMQYGIDPQLIDLCEGHVETLLRS